MGTWLKSMWEKVDKFRIMVEIAPLPVCPPKEGDKYKWFMQAVIEAGVTDPNKQRIFNRFGCHQQVLYVSNVLDAGGKCLAKNYLDHQKPDKPGSTLVFPQEKPPKKHLHLWRQVLYAIAPQGRVQNWVGHFITATRSGSGDTTKTPCRFFTSKVW
jgi:hypothetical protein